MREEQWKVDLEGKFSYDVARMILGKKLVVTEKGENPRQVLTFQKGCWNEKKISNVKLANDNCDYYAFTCFSHSLYLKEILL